MQILPTFGVAFRLLTPCAPRAVRRYSSTSVRLPNPFSVTVRMSDLLTQSFSSNSLSAFSESSRRFSAVLTAAASAIQSPLGAARSSSLGLLKLLFGLLQRRYASSVSFLVRFSLAAHSSRSLSRVASESVMAAPMT